MAVSKTFPNHFFEIVVDSLFPQRKPSEVNVPVRMLAFVLLLVPLAPAQQPMAGHASGGMWADREIRPEPLRDADLRAARVQAIQHDAQQLSELNSALQSQLQQLQKGMLARDLAENLRKAEKLAKKLRQEVAP